MTTRVLVAAVLITTLSCNFLTQSVQGGGTSEPGVTREAGVTPDLHPTHFAAQATSGVSVQLAWPEVAGAQKYLLEVKAGDGDFLPLALLGADKTSYEDVGVPEEFELTYRLRVQTASGTSAGESATVTTPAAAPNPLTVQASEYRPITWSPPTPDPKHPITDPSKMFPPGFDPAHPESFDPSALLTPVEASAEIGPAGGSVSIITPDQITYELTIPAGALEAATTITLVPIESVDGLPFSGGLQGAVRIEPTGLILDLPARLTITAPEKSPAAQGSIHLGFSFGRGGEEFHLYPLAYGGSPGSWAPGAAHLALHANGWDAGPSMKKDCFVYDLENYGVAVGTPAEARTVIKTHQPSAADLRVINELAYGQTDPEDLAPLVQPAQDDLAPLVPTRSMLATQKTLERARDVTTLSGVSSVMEGFEVILKLYGKDKGLQDKYKQVWDVLLETLFKILRNMKNRCLTADDAMTQAIVSRMTKAPKGSFGDTLATEFKKRYGDSVLKDVAAMTKACILNLEIDSRIKAYRADTVAYIVQVKGTIYSLKFNYAHDTVYLTGHGFLTYKPVEVIPQTQRSRKFKCDPWVPRDSISAEVTITRLEPKFVDAAGAVLTDLSLTSMSVKDDAPLRGEATCTATDSDGKTQTLTQSINLPTNRGSVWYGLFFAAHIPHVVIDGWTDPRPGGSQVNGSNQPIIAGWLSKRDNFLPTGGSGNDWSETSTFLLVDATPK